MRHAQPFIILLSLFYMRNVSVRTLWSLVSLVCRLLLCFCCSFHTFFSLSLLHFMCVTVFTHAFLFLWWKLSIYVKQTRIRKSARISLFRLRPDKFVYQSTLENSWKSYGSLARISAAVAAVVQLEHDIGDKCVPICLKAMKKS